MVRHQERLGALARRPGGLVTVSPAGRPFWAGSMGSARPVDVGPDAAVTGATPSVACSRDPVVACQLVLRGLMLLLSTNCTGVAVTLSTHPLPYQEVLDAQEASRSRGHGGRGGHAGRRLRKWFQRN